MRGLATTILGILVKLPNHAKTCHDKEVQAPLVPITTYDAKEPISTVNGF
jgi:hypothetical protein